MKKIVIALGGNAILKKGEKVSIENQAENIKEALEKVFPIIKNNQTIITHGNGPQVGYLLLQQETAKDSAYFPLDTIDAQTEGMIGYLIQQNLQNLLLRNKIKRDAVTILTQVLVSRRDEAFGRPSKFIGPYYTKRQAEKMKKLFDLEEDSGKGWRRVVASPKAIEIIETEIIKKMLRNKMIVIAGGGGGIPVVKNGGYLEGIECVVDKDAAAECLASSIKAEELIIVTDVDRVYINYGLRNQKALTKISVDDLEEYHRASHFPLGSMGPKVQAAIDFLRKGGKKAIIGNVETIKRGGTVITH